MQKDNNIIHEVNKVKVKFTKKSMTAYGGFSLLASFFEKIELREHIETIIPIQEKSPNGTGVYAKVISYTLIMFAGGNRFSHILYLGSQEILSKLFRIKRLIKSGTSLTRMFNKMNSMKESNDVSTKLWSYLEKLIPWKDIKEDWLNFDSTVIERYGKQEGSVRGYNPKKKGRPSHNPLIGFLNQSKYVVHLWNRPGNASSGNNIQNFFNESYERVKDKIKIAGVVADSGFYNFEFISLLEKKLLTYVIAARLYKPLQRNIYKQKDWGNIDIGIDTCEFEYKHDTWDKSRKYIAIRQNVESRPKSMGKQLKLFTEIEEKNYRYSVWITNSTQDAKTVWGYCKPRANDENIIKELKEDFALGGFSMNKFYATEVAMLIRVLIYNLFVLFRSIVLEPKEKTQRLKTLRYKYFVIPAQLGSWGRDTILRLSVDSNKVRKKLIRLYDHLAEYVAFDPAKCNAFGI
jgi:hypothetical protein